ncbi:MAG: type B chloramphenicol O-acetyltransferase [Stappia sp.]|uniref:type B chloramphenicol O-acetyltransferase n=1 Tax=Stappia sp. TaxID=1870903 RepID=UPI000C5999AF|nr:type B chloramphenicol O-acetyltransferase [Stappia sp.]MAA98590.1 type B chloramphenicol O-acetyltransferase [Stappia sp.]MBM20581.1 type B chloramphenicol O-acetyltransferase [Stappia sp.]
MSRRTGPLITSNGPERAQPHDRGQSPASNFFESPFKGKLLSEQVTNPNISVGRYSYYSGYYHGHSFDDCARYLMPDRDDVDRLVIGSFCSIGTGACFVMAGNQSHRSDWVSTFPFFFMSEEPAFADAHTGYEPAGDTVVGNDVWIGAEAMIMPGVTIGHGAMIGARALVTKDVAPYSVVGGNPAREIRKRFSAGEIDMLLEMAWWDWPLEEIRGEMQALCSSDIAGLHARWRARR